MTDILDTSPTYQSPTTRVWALDPFDDQTSCGLGSWYVHAPWMHPAWHSYVCSLIHLRRVPGESPAFLKFPEATHEFLVFALDPKHKFDQKELHVLTPPNIVRQFTRDTDAYALEIVTDRMILVGEGSVSLDSDFRSHWEQLL